MIEQINDLERRVQQLEAALMAVSLKQPVGCDQYGRVIAAPPHVGGISETTKQQLGSYGIFVGLK